MEHYDEIYYENLYVDDMNFDNSITRHLIPPKFVAGKSCIHIFFVRYELYMNTVNQNWNDAFRVNMLCNLVCDKTLLVIINFSPEILNSYERTKRQLIAYLATGENNEMLWHKLNNRRQELSQTVIEFFNDLLALNKVLQVPSQILKQIFVAGLRTEIKQYLEINFDEDMTLEQVFYLAKKFEVINNSTIFGKTQDCNESVGEQSCKDKIPHYGVSGKYSNWEKENDTINNLEQGIYNEKAQEIIECYDNNYINEFFPAQFQEYERGNFDNFIDSQFDTSQNEFSHQKIGYQTRNYYTQQPRCAVVQVNKQDRNWNISEIKKQNTTSNVFSQDTQNNLSVPRKRKINYADNYNSVASLGRRRRRMRGHYSTKNRFLNRDRKVADYQDHIVQQNSDIPQGKKISHKNKPYVSVITTKDDKVEGESNNGYISSAGVLVENVDLEPNMVTQTFINGKVEKGLQLI